VVSVVVPAYNEAQSIAGVVRDLQAAVRLLPCPAELIVVDDGSQDDTSARAAAVRGVRVLRNPVNLGYGHSLMRGVAAARGGLIAICDADGTYPAHALVRLHEHIQKGVDHAIGARTGAHLSGRWLSRAVYRWLCGYVVGCRVPDANSGLRIFRRELVERLRGDLCRGFSFTTSLTLASVMSGYVIAFEEIPYERRTGRSHVRLRDTLRTAQYLFQLIAVYNPIKLFLPVVAASALLALSAGLAGYTGAWAAGGLAAAVLAATTLLLVGLAGHAYILSRTGLPPLPLPTEPASVSEAERVEPSRNRATGRHPLSGERASPAQSGRHSAD
jgi:glycosyltransferase involved in cell wall biosynthesis